MPEVTAVDAKGNVYLVPQDVLVNHCKMLGNILDIKGALGDSLSDWPNCYLWINGDDPPWINCPEISAVEESLWAKMEKGRIKELVAQQFRAERARGLRD